MAGTTLVIMAAGIGSRFGQGIKQLTAFGPSGEIIMDYSIYDALEAGFDKIVFVIRKDLEKDFKEIIGSRIEKHAKIAYAFQNLEDLPEGFTLPEGRTKPWGTGQAILACNGIVKEPFAVINADDYYGKEAFKLIHDYLTTTTAYDEQGKMQIGMAGFILKNTLSDNGGVTRGICRLDEHNALIGVDETSNIVRTDGGAAVEQKDGSLKKVDPESLVSMNFWGFAPEFIDVLKTGFADFVSKLTPETQMKGEYLLPTIVDDMIQAGKATVCVRSTPDRWFGVTYHQDVPTVKEEFRKLIEQGVYPAKLWKD